VLDARYTRNSERFARGRLKVLMIPESVTNNPMQPNQEGMMADGRVNFLTLAAAGHQKEC